MADAAILYRIPPSNEEREYYYHDCAVRPRLIARSSQHVWSPVQDGHYLEMEWIPAGDHPMVDAWQDFASPIRREIFQTLNPVDWRVIEIMRAGYCGINSQTGQEFDHPVTFLVTVQAGSIAWAQAIVVVLQCQHILQRHGILDVDCEMKETRY